jgi:MFS family permease
VQILSEATTKSEDQLLESKTYLGWIMFVLVLVYTFNFIDRSILSILAIPIQKEFGFSDFVMGLMRGVGFAFVYATLGIPVARLADRRNRVWIIATALTIWSGMTAACGLAGNAVHLFFARVGVGIGEAGGAAPSYSIISDYFPPHKRATALGIFSLAIPIGSAVGIVFGAVMATLYGWRMAFYVIGGLGVLLAPLLVLTVREPKRGRYDNPKEVIKTASFSDVIKTIRSKKSFWLISFGAASSSIMGYGVFAWIPAFLVRSFGDDLAGFLSFVPSWMIPAGASSTLYAAYYFSLIMFIGGLVGIFLGGFLADKLGAKNKAAYVLVPAIAFLVTVPFYITGVLTTNLTVLFFILLFPVALSLAWLGPVISALQHIVPTNMRATSTAIFLFINNFLGLAIGDPLLGKISDLLKGPFGEESLRYSILSGTIFYMLASVLFFLAAKHIKNEWVQS